MTKLIHAYETCDGVNWLPRLAGLIYTVHTTKRVPKRQTIIWPASANNDMVFFTQTIIIPPRSISWFEGKLSSSPKSSQWTSVPLRLALPTGSSRPIRGQENESITTKRTILANVQDNSERNFPSRPRVNNVCLS